MIVIDGGRAQLNAAKKVLFKMQLQIPIIELAKKFEEIYVYGNNKPIVIRKNEQALKLLQKIRDEAHRFAITYHRLLRSNVLGTDILHFRIRY